MQWIRKRIDWIMIGAGVLTLTMLHAVVAPDAAFQATFGERLDGAAARLVVRNWGLLIAAVGGLLIYGARRPAVRPAALAIAAITKLGFIALVLSHGTRYLSSQAGIAVAIDGVVVLIAIGYLLFPARS